MQVKQTFFWSQLRCMEVKVVLACFKIQLISKSVSLVQSQMFRCFKEFILNWILLACLCCIFCPVVIIFPNRFCSQLNLQGTAELGEPPSTLPTVSHTKYRLMNAQDIWESSHNPTAYMQLKTLNCPSVQIMCLCPVMNWQTCPGCSPCLHTLCTEDMLQEIPAAPLGWMDRSAFNASMPQ